MARMDFQKAQRVQLWRESTHAAWSGHVPQATKSASAKQINYIQALLDKAGRRRLTIEETGSMTMAGASRLLKELTGQ